MSNANKDSKAPESNVPPQTEMNAPPTQTQMNAREPKGVKMVKVKALRGFARSDGDVLPGQILTVPEEEAKHLCRVHEGPCNFFGERYGSDVTKGQVQNAQMVS